MTHTLCKKIEVKKSFGSKESGNRQTNGRARPIALPSPLTRSKINQNKTTADKLIPSTFSEEVQEARY